MPLSRWPLFIYLFIYFLLDIYYYRRFQEVFRGQDVRDQEAVRGGVQEGQHQHRLSHFPHRPLSVPVTAFIEVLRRKNLESSIPSLHWLRSVPDVTCSLGKDPHLCSDFYSP
jgi:hypothetical protein